MMSIEESLVRVTAERDALRAELAAAKAEILDREAQHRSTVKFYGEGLAAAQKRIAELEQRLHRASGGPVHPSDCVRRQ